MADPIILPRADRSGIARGRSLGRVPSAVDVPSAASVRDPGLTVPRIDAGKGLAAIGEGLDEVGKALTRYQAKHDAIETGKEELAFKSDTLAKQRELEGRTDPEALKEYQEWLQERLAKANENLTNRKVSSHETAIFGNRLGLFSKGAEDQYATKLLVERDKEAADVTSRIVNHVSAEAERNPAGVGAQLEAFRNHIDMRRGDMKPDTWRNAKMAGEAAIVKASLYGMIKARQFSEVNKIFAEGKYDDILSSADRNAVKSFMAAEQQRIEPDIAFTAGKGVVEAAIAASGGDIRNMATGDMVDKAIRAIRDPKAAKAASEYYNTLRARAEDVFKLETRAAMETAVKHVETGASPETLPAPVKSRLLEAQVFDKIVTVWRNGQEGIDPPLTQAAADVYQKAMSLTGKELADFNIYQYWHILPKANRQHIIDRQIKLAQEATDISTKEEAGMFEEVYRRLNWGTGTDAKRKRTAFETQAREAFRLFSKEQADGKREPTPDEKRIIMRGLEQRVLSFPRDNWVADLIMFDKTVTVGQPIPTDLTEKQRDGARVKFETISPILKDQLTATLRAAGVRPDSNGQYPDEFYEALAADHVLRDIPRSKKRILQWKARR